MSTPVVFGPHRLSFIEYLALLREMNLPLSAKSLVDCPAGGVVAPISLNLFFLLIAIGIADRPWIDAVRALEAAATLYSRGVPVDSCSGEGNAQRQPSVRPGT